MVCFLSDTRLGTITRQVDRQLTFLVHAFVFSGFSVGTECDSICDAPLHKRGKEVPNSLFVPGKERRESEAGEF